MATTRAMPVTSLNSSPVPLFTSSCSHKRFVNTDSWPPCCTVSANRQCTSSSGVLVRCTSSSGAENTESAAFRGNVGTPVLRSRITWRLEQACRAASGEGEPSSSGGSTGVSEGGENPQETGERIGDIVGARRKGGDARAADSTDWISSNLTRRFGLGAGLAWVGVLAFGVISEQIKTRTEVFREEQGTRDVEGSKEVILPNGICYTDLREGGGASPQRGDLVLISLIGKVVSTGEVFVDTTAKGNRSLIFVFGAKPYSGGMCDGLEYILKSMKVGGKRRVTIPPALGFGETGTILNSGINILGNESLEYVVELQKASIAPS